MYKLLSFLLFFLAFTQSAQALNIQLHDINSFYHEKPIMPDHLLEIVEGKSKLEEAILNDVESHIGIGIISFQKHKKNRHFQAEFQAHTLMIPQPNLIALLSTAKNEVPNDKISEPFSFYSLGFTDNNHKLLSTEAESYIDNDNSINNRFRIISLLHLRALDNSFEFVKYHQKPDEKFLIEIDSHTLTLDGIVLINQDYLDQKYNISALFAHEMLGIFGLQLSDIPRLAHQSIPLCHKAAQCLTFNFYHNQPLGTVADLFRYSEISSKMGINDWTVKNTEMPLQAQAYFSIDGGKTPLIYFANGKPNSRLQAGLWHEDASTGLNSPILGTDFKGEFSEEDLISLQALGWQTKKIE